MAFAVLRIRSPRKKQKKMEDTLKMLRLNRVNHCTVVPDVETYKGMLNRVKDFITWGEVNEETLSELLKHRSDIELEEMEKKIKDQTSCGSVEEFVEAVLKDEITIDEVDGLRNLFRLHPPEGGYKGIKKAYKNGGALGYRGQDINDLLMIMLGPEYEYDDEAVEEEG
ncbi:MAG: 50S ribosomal protein L30 [Candidatus Natronoplasma sp.]